MVSAIILAGGMSLRMRGVNKMTALIGDTPVLAMSMLRFQECDEVGEIIVAAGKGSFRPCQTMAKKYGITKLKAVVHGGDTRYYSMRNALKEVSPDAELLAVHDAARPLIKIQDIYRVIDDARVHGASIIAVPAVDAIKDTAFGFVKDLFLNKIFYCSQTPQVFSLPVFLKCLENLDLLGADMMRTRDDCEIFQRFDKPVHLTEIGYSNMKITFRDDLVLANALYAKRLEEKEHEDMLTADAMRLLNEVKKSREKGLELRKKLGIQAE